MSKIFLIKAYDLMYDGLHGMYEVEIEEFENEEAVHQYATEMSLNVINSYHDIYNTFEEEAECNGYEPDSEEWHDYIQTSIEEDIAYDIYEIDDKEEDWDDLISKFEEDEEEFIHKYCIEY